MGLEKRVRLLPVVLVAAFSISAPAVSWGAGRVLPSMRSRVSKEGVARPAGVPDDATLEAGAARIGTVLVKPLEVFDTSLPEENTVLFRLANRIHVRSRDATIRDQLLFKEGESYVARRLQETERTLRTLRYLRDAWVTPVAWRDGVVDVEVRTQDVWTLNPGVSFGRKGGVSTSGAELEELNLFGAGQRLSLGVKNGVDRTSTSLQFEDPQLGSTWWRLRTTLSDNSDGTAAQLALEHPFYAFDTRRAGGFSLLRDSRTDYLYDLGEISDRFQTEQRHASAWYGWSRGYREGWTTRFSVGYDFDESRFAALPGRAADARAVPSGRRLAYPWLGVEWVENDFVKTRNRDQMERSEDIALGWRVALRLGQAAPAFGADRTAGIFQASASHGWQPAPAHLVLASAETRGRVEEGLPTAMVSSASARWYFRESSKWLLYAGASVDAGRRLDADTQLLLGGDSGLRGYPLRYQGGEGRWLVTVEQRFFSNLFPLRLFNVGGAVFFDAGRTWGANPAGTPSQRTLKDVGIGLRLGNNRSALGNVVHVDLAFPLDGDRSISRTQLVIETRRSF